MQTFFNGVIALAALLASAHGASAQEDDDSLGRWIGSTKTAMQKFGGKIASL